MSELKPCPFCGSDEILILSGSNLLWWWCECNNPECLASTNSRSRPTNQEAVTAWNTRATDAELERLRADLARVTAERDAAIVEAQQAANDRAIMKAQLDRGEAERGWLREALIRLAAAADDVPLRFYPAELTEAIDQARATLNGEGEG